MEKLKFFMLSLLVTLTFGLTSCSDDDDESAGSSTALVGTWDIKERVYRTEYPGKEAKVETEESENCYYVFTDKKVTIHDPDDLANGQTLDYSYNSSTGKLIIMGMEARVTELTSTKLVIRSEFVEDGIKNVTIMTCYKR